MIADVPEIRISQVQLLPEAAPPEGHGQAVAAPLKVSAVRTFLLARGNSAMADRGFHWLMVLCALSIFGIVVLIASELVIRSKLAWGQFGLDFFYKAYIDTYTHQRIYWDPVNGHFSALPFLYGTLVSSFLALLMAVPLAIGVAVFLTEMCPRGLRAPLAFLTELLAAIPSVIYGLWAVFVLVPLLREHVNPLLIKSLVPHSQREAVLALGATRWEMIRMGVLRNARIGIVGAVILGLGRALGETMAVTMVIGNSLDIQRSLLSNGNTMASAIANQFAEAAGDLHLSALMELGLALFIVTIIVNALAQVLVWAVTRGVPSQAR